MVFALIKKHSLPKAFAFSFFGFFLSLSSPAAAPLDQVLKPYEAEYSLSWRGVSVGKSKHILQSSDGQHFEMESRTYPFVRLLPYRYHEQSLFEKKAASILALTYTFDHQEGTKHKEGTLDLNTFPSGTQDKITYLFLLRADLLDHKKELHYKIADEDGGVIEYHFERMGEENLETPMGTLKTVVVQHQSRKRTTTLWLAPELNYLPIKLKQMRKGAEIAGGELLYFELK